MSRRLLLAIYSIVFVCILSILTARRFIADVNICPADVRDLLDVHISGLEASRTSAPVLPLLADLVSETIVGLEEIQADYFTGHDHSSLTSLLDVDTRRAHLAGLLTLWTQLNVLERSMLSLRNRACFAQRMLSQEIREYQRTIRASTLPLWLRALPPPSLYKLLSSEIVLYQEEVEKVIVALRALSTARHELRSFDGSLRALLPDMLNATSVTFDYNNSTDNRSTALVTSLEIGGIGALRSWPHVWAVCKAVEEDLLSSFKAHSRETAEMRRRTSLGETSSCSLSPAREGSLYQDDGLLSFFEGVAEIFSVWENEWLPHMGSQQRL